MVALTLPDIAAKIDSPKAKSGPRYAAWVETYLTPKYYRPAGHVTPEHTFLSGDDCYALRCAFLHEGGDETAHHPASKTLERFQFLGGGFIHCNQADKKLQLEVGAFCRDICAAVETWLTSIPTTDRARLDRLKNLATIQTSGPCIMI